MRKEDLVKNWKDDEQEQENDEGQDDMKPGLPSLDMIIEHPFAVTILFLMGLVVYLINLGEMNYFPIPLGAIVIVLINWKFYKKRRDE